MEARSLIAFILPPVVGGVIGWFTNYLAVKMLFHPRQPVRLLFFDVQGVFPKRQKALAANFGRMVEQELISHEDVRRVITDPAFQEKFKAPLGEYVERFIIERLTSLSPMVSMFLSDQMRERIRGLITAELEKLVPDIIERAALELEDRLDFGDLARRKVEALSLDRLEDLLVSSMKREFKFIELSGGVLGVLIGLVQAVLQLWL